VNSLTVPSVVAPSYAPKGLSLISVVVVGRQSERASAVETVVHKELRDWFGGSVDDWRLLKTYRIPHALPDQTPPIPDPTVGLASERSGIYVCGEYNSVPGIQWSLLSGRQTAERILEDLKAR
jgi:phytoene dehydrogenase-like protein